MLNLGLCAYQASPLSLSYCTVWPLLCTSRTGQAMAPALGGLPDLPHLVLPRNSLPLSTADPFGCYSANDSRSLLLFQGFAVLVRTKLSKLVIATLCSRHASPSAALNCLQDAPSSMFRRAGVTLWCPLSAPSWLSTLEADPCTSPEERLWPCQEGITHTDTCALTRALGHHSPRLRSGWIWHWSQRT